MELILLVDVFFIFHFVSHSIMVLNRVAQDYDAVHNGGGVAPNETDLLKQSFENLFNESHNDDEGSREFEFKKGGPNNWEDKSNQSSNAAVYFTSDHDDAKDFGDQINVEDEIEEIYEFLDHNEGIYVKSSQNEIYKK